jgi:hypothetical protein
MIDGIRLPSGNGVVNATSAVGMTSAGSWLAQGGSSGSESGIIRKIYAELGVRGVILRITLRSKARLLSRPPIGRVWQPLRKTMFKIAHKLILKITYQVSGNVKGRMQT